MAIRRFSTRGREPRPNPRSPGVCRDCNQFCEGGLVYRCCSACWQHRTEAAERSGFVVVYPPPPPTPLFRQALEERERDADPGRFAR